MNALPLARFERAYVRLLLGSLVLMAGGCASSTVMRVYQQEHHCPHLPQVIAIDDTRYRANGCSGPAEYKCTSGTVCVPMAPETGDDGTTVLVRLEDASSAEATGRSSVRRGKGADGTPIVISDIELRAGAKIELRGAPERYRDVVQLEMARPRSAKEKDGSCELMMLINNERVTLPTTESSVAGRKNVHRVKVSRERLMEMGNAQHIAVRACDERWTLEPGQLMEVRHFAAAWLEERAWSDSEQSAPGGLTAPTAGWPGWSGAGQMPVASADKTLSGEEVYALLLPSVYKLEVLAMAGTSWGSAVAISEHELATNCHVVAGARKIILHKNETTATAKVLRADPKADRCVIEVPDVKLVPVKGVRATSDLKIGEAAYTLGSPAGLESSLASGNVSALRNDGDQTYVQTSAPISPGSSGGGLFDARGNLIGITTMALVGKYDQALNFAIPAERFFQN